jgi:succinate dehydrogenase cytochrome b subunit
LKYSAARSVNRADAASRSDRPGRLADTVPDGQCAGSGLARLTGTARRPGSGGKGNLSMLVRILTSSIGRKVLMAVTGLLLIGFLILHLGGNLLIFVGPETYNRYSHTLLSPPLLYLVYLIEFLLLLLFVAHFVSGILVFLHNRAARPEKYRTKVWQVGYTSHKSVSSLTMIVSGLVLLVFVPIHLREFKFGADYPSAIPGVRDLYRLVVEIFQQPTWAAWYAFAMTIVGFHLWHGFGSAFESLGLSYRTPVRRFGQLLAVIIAGGFFLIPVIIYLTRGKP